MALNNVGFVTPGGQRWTLLRNALHFLTEGEQARLDPALRACRPARRGGGAPGRPPFGRDRRTVHGHDRTHRNGQAQPEQPDRGTATSGLRSPRPAPAR